MTEQLNELPKGQMTDGPDSAKTVVEIPVIDVPVIPQSKDYLLTIQVRFQAGDDPDAREKAHLWNFTGIRNPGPGEGVKLQEVRKDGPPRKIDL